MPFVCLGGLVWHWLPVLRHLDGTGENQIWLIFKYTISTWSSGIVEQKKQQKTRAKDLSDDARPTLSRCIMKRATAPNPKSLWPYIRELKTKLLKKNHLLLLLLLPLSSHHFPLRFLIFWSEKTPKQTTTATLQSHCTILIMSLLRSTLCRKSIWLRAKILNSQTCFDTFVLFHTHPFYVRPVFDRLRVWLGKL